MKFNRTGKNKKEMQLISLMESQLQETEEKIEIQKTLNKNIRKKRLILIFIIFAIATLAVISFKIALTADNDKKLAKYSYTDEDIEEQLDEIYKKIAETDEKIAEIKSHKR